MIYDFDPYEDERAAARDARDNTLADPPDRPTPEEAYLDSLPSAPASTGSLIPRRTETSGATPTGTTSGDLAASSPCAAETPAGATGQDAPAGNLADPVRPATVGNTPAADALPPSVAGNPSERAA